jgi:HTH-type transcriptional regulator/antitoxin HigA
LKYEKAGMAMDRKAGICKHCPAANWRSSTVTSAEVIQQINAYMGSLKLLITDYEARTFKFRKPSAVDMLKELMERHSLKQTDFEREIGKQPHVSRILNGERELTLPQSKALGKRFNVSPEIFL